MIAQPVDLEQLLKEIADEHIRSEERIRRCL